MDEFEKQLEKFLEVYKLNLFRVWVFIAQNAILYLFVIGIYERPH